DAAWVGLGGLGFRCLSRPTAFSAIGLSAASLGVRGRFATAACEDRCYGPRRQYRGQNSRHQAMHTDMDVPIPEFDRRPVRPDLQPSEILGGYVLQCADPGPGNQETGIPRCHDLDGVAIRDIAD